ncbi:MULTISPECIES: hypothetical protein [Streptomyces]|uniref:GNAT family N-acetyltransferase n=1 Tax=Streptomyces bacillaris TaxID=68179 RepID=A0ABW6DZP1_9ACTN|nr:hypothetical protein [Streptomyces nanshensis]
MNRSVPDDVMDAMVTVLTGRVGDPAAGPPPWAEGVWPLVLAVQG